MRLAAEQSRLPVVAGYLDALRSRDVPILSVQHLLRSPGAYGFVFCLPPAPSRCAALRRAFSRYQRYA